MNVKLIFEDRIESWDTRADGSATTSHAQLVVVDGASLQLWSSLWRDEFDESGRVIDGARDVRERGCPREIARLRIYRAVGLEEFCEALHEEEGLLRLDVDGEAVYTFEPGAEGPGAY